MYLLPNKTGKRCNFGGHSSSLRVFWFFSPQSLETEKLLDEEGGVHFHSEKKCLLRRLNSTIYKLFLVPFWIEVKCGEKKKQNSIM